MDDGQDGGPADNRSRNSNFNDVSSHPLGRSASQARDRGDQIAKERVEARDCFNWYHCQRDKLHRFFCLVFLATRGEWVAFDQTADVKADNQDRKPLTMREIFDSDFDGVAKIFNIQEMVLSSDHIKFPAIEYIDISTNSFFFAFYIDEKQPPLVMAEAILHSLDAIRKNLGQIVFEVNTPGSTRTLKNSTMNFSRQVYLIF